MHADVARCLPVPSLPAAMRGLEMEVYAGREPDVGSLSNLHQLNSTYTVENSKEWSFRTIATDIWETPLNSTHNWLSL